MSKNTKFYITQCGKTVWQTVIEYLSSLQMGSMG